MIKMKKSKTKKMTLAKLEVKKPVTHLKRDDVMNKVTPIATGVAVTAGLVAVGSALTDKENRAKIVKHSQKGVDILQSVIEALKEEAPKAYQAVAHNIQPTMQPRKRKRGRRSSSTK